MDFVLLLTDYDPKYIEPALVDPWAPVRYTLAIDGETDLLTKVIKSKNASVEIPEFDLRILPGLNSKGLICDVVGLLSRIEDAIKATWGVDDIKKEELLEKIGLLIEGKAKATLVLIDPSGLSLIMGNAAKEMLNT
jgi:ZPR1 zinc finger protein